MVILLSFLKSITILMPPSFFLTGIGGLDHLDEEGSMMPRDSKFSISSLKASWCAREMV